MVMRRVRTISAALTSISAKSNAKVGTAFALSDAALGWEFV